MAWHTARPGLNLRVPNVGEGLSSHATALAWTGVADSAIVDDYPGYTWALDMPDTTEVPHFAYIELFENGHVFHGVSSGRGKYLEIDPESRIPPVAFTVQKDRMLKTISIDIHSAMLNQSVSRAILTHCKGATMHPLDFDTVLKYYDPLKEHLHRLEARYPSDTETLEVRLLVKDLLRDRAIYEGIGMEEFRNRQVLSSAHLHDIHQRSVDAGLDAIDDCFALGLIPDYINEDYLDALNSKYSELALAGDFSGLYNLCEPIVRSGEIEMQYNPSLLLELLNEGRLDIYRYVLDLVSRTRESPVRSPGSCLPDITYDPLYVAIRLGHVERVESLLLDGATFEGQCFEDNASNTSHIFTPLSAAVFWRQPGIVRTLLQQNPVQAGLQVAIAIALSSDDYTDIIRILLESGSLPDLAVPSGKNADDLIWDFGTEGSGQSATHNAEPVVGQCDSSQSQLLPDEIDQPQIADRANHRPSDTGFSAKPTTFVRRKRARRRRHAVGQDLVAALTNMCSQVRTICGRSPHDALRSMGTQFLFFGKTWDRGMDGFRRLMKNEPPSTLLEVVECLLVASAMCTVLFKEDDSIYMQFVDDLGRWRSVLDGSEHEAFNDLAFSLWAYTDSRDSTDPTDQCSHLFSFQELVQNLVCLERNPDLIPLPRTASGTRLCAIQKGITNDEPAHTFRQGRNLRVPPDLSGSPSLSLDQGVFKLDMEPGEDPDFRLGDFVNLDLFVDDAGEEAEETATPPPSIADWKDILSATVLLLASIAFSVVTILILGLHFGFDSAQFSLIGEQPGYGRSAAILEAYLGLVDHTASTRRGAALYVVDPSILQRPLRTRSDASSSAPSPELVYFNTPSSEMASFGPADLPRTASFSSISVLSTSLPSSTSSPGPSRKRLTCTSSQCTKTFSSVSNRNKHLREGCAFRDKRGYRCRNAPCSKVLTTKWYRDTHEKDRCRFAGA